MKKATIFASMFILMLFMVIGCVTSKGNTSQSKDIEYYIPQYTSTIEHNTDNVIWKEDDLTLTAKKSPAKEKYISKTVISSIELKNKNKQYEILFKEEPISVDSVGLSANKDYLTLNSVYHYGYKLLVVNLNTGEHFILNDLLELTGIGFVETIHPYSWSPDKNNLAFAFGNTSRSNIAIYNPDKKILSLIPIPTENNYITTARILWHSSGDGFDFVSECIPIPNDPPINFKQYRYLINQDSVEFIKDVSLKELRSMPKTIDFLKDLPKPDDLVEPTP